ncbi:hypothetical protein HN51_068743 [Arachis hypogaea]|nr:uncharacterized protein LOC107642969 isoform X1 [Arachis ipaensis]XP_025653607.1 uncharacterized protein LOC112749543 isoform X1 [Arachis hypogaea]QHO10859.1 Nuclear pore complex protein [Arachis hypogaea]
MRGSKRLAVSEPNHTDTNETVFRNKRIMEGSLFDVHRAEPSQQTMAVPSLDMRRAESSQKHVRALNTQFASWVQTQLQNHPDELWEDGVRDYLEHAAGIMEKFSDVVNWIKANATKGENLPADVGASFAGKKLSPDVTNKENKTSGEKTGSTTASPASNFASPAMSFGSPAMNFGSPATNFASPATNFSSPVTNFATPLPNFASSAANSASSAANFATPATSWGAGLFSNSQKPFTFGTQNSAPSNNDASDDVDGENDLEQPSSPSVKKSEEKGIIVVHEVKCKLFVKSSDTDVKNVWKDKGMGQLCIKCKEGVSKATKESKPTIIVRNEVGKILLNALLYPGIKTHLQKNTLVAIFHTSDIADGSGENNDSVVARTFLIKVKTEEDRNKLASIIQEYAPGS